MFASDGPLSFGCLSGEEGAPPICEEEGMDDWNGMGEGPIALLGTAGEAGGRGSDPRGGGPCPWGVTAKRQQARNLWAMGVPGLAAGLAAHITQPGR